MNLNRSLLTLLFFTFLSVGANAQKVEIGTNRFFSYVNRARDNAELFNRRVVRKEEDLKGSIFVITETEINEHIIPDRSRWTFNGLEFGKKVSIEQIEIGDVKYCRKGKGRWEKRNCRSRTIMGGGEFSNVMATSEEILIGGKTHTKYVYYYTWDREDGSQRFVNLECMVDDQGRMKSEIETSGDAKTKKISSKMARTFEYDPKDLKIVAPVK